MDNNLVQEQETIRKRALRILGTRNYSELEMYKKLTSKGENPKSSEETVKWLVELGYINDSHYADLIVNHYVAKGYGEARIKNELYKRGIPRDMWEDKLSIIEETEIEDAAFEFLCKKLKGSTDKNDIRRATDALVRRGFSYEDARKSVCKYLEEA
ncbi:MAG: recombination regulator RecX [Oscillospiraceae bacterium]|jgi:regulatory protein|nr:recombination regulator RecX [Oscillospiraceae bacterium]